MSTRRAARSSRAAKQTIIDSSADVMLDTDQPDDHMPDGMVADQPTDQPDTLPDGYIEWVVCSSGESPIGDPDAYDDQPSHLLPALLAGESAWEKMLAFLAAANEPTKLVIDALPSVHTDADLSSIASDMLATPTDAARSSVPSGTRYDIGLHAARLMIRRGIGVSSAVVLIRESLDRMNDRRGIPIPRVWRDLRDIDHALKCWLPGTVASASLPVPWPAITRNPFYGLPDYVVSRIRLGAPGYDHGGLVCDYISRVDPRVMSLSLIERYDQLTTRDDRRAFWNEILKRDDR